MGNPKLRMMVDVGADVYGNLDKFCSGIFKVCVKCMSECRNVYVVACRKEEGRQACCCINMLSSSTRSVGSCMLLNVWHVNIAFELEINKS